MKLAQIVLPMLDNAGHELTEEHAALAQTLRMTWGGYTSIEGVGGWKDAHGKLYAERVIVYYVAMALADAPRLRNLAEHVAKEARQHSVMIVTPNGDVEFVHPSTSMGEA